MDELDKIMKNLGLDDDSKGHILATKKFRHKRKLKISNNNDCHRGFGICGVYATSRMEQLFFKGYERSKIDVCFCKL